MGGKLQASKPGDTRGGDPPLGTPLFLSAMSDRTERM